jgi:hypothetical protein
MLFWEERRVMLGYYDDGESIYIAMQDANDVGYRKTHM